MNRRRDTAFTVELTGLFILLIAVITIISSVFVMSRAHSLQARQLTEAVILAESTAETISAEPDRDELSDAAADMDNTYGHRAIVMFDDDTVTVLAAATIDRYDTSSDAEPYLIRITRTYQEGGDGSGQAESAYVQDVIDIYEPGTFDPEDLSDIDLSRLSEPLYTLATGTYFGAEETGGEGGRP